MRRMVFATSMISCLFVLFLANLSTGQDRGITVSESKGAVKTELRSALVIGNGSYESAPLRNPVNDSKAVAETLRGLGFDVVERQNLDQKEMKKEVQSFGQKLLKGGVGLFYFAGHGMQVNGRNYLIPVGASIEHEKQVEYEAVDAGSVLSEMDHARNRLNIVVLDACRDNPFARSFRSSAQGLASMNAPSGTLIAYATAPGSVAGDGPGENGVYTGELVRVMQLPGLRIEDIFKQVRSAVREATQGKQVPWESSSLEGDFYFKASQTVPVETVAQERSTAPPTTEARTHRGERPVKAFKTWKEPVSGIEFIWIPGGCFLMGSPQAEKNRDADEGPVHEVCVDGFWMAKTEVTNGQYRKFDPSHNSKDFNGVSLNGDSQPVVNVNWIDAVNFAQWLQVGNGGQFKFRLPTEAEWEYACRAGSEAIRYWGDGEESVKACAYENVADLTAKRQWKWEESHDCDDGYATTAPVGSFQANGFGLHDMLGNVWEWTEDVYGVDAYAGHDRKNPVLMNEDRESSRVIRGGYWRSVPGALRCADRGNGLPAGMSDNLGFRLIREQDSRM